ncbi:phospholipase D-like domain-containing protein [Microbacterium sp. p3-SID338]|uniref:phospholipase D-like domain-containing protein n=1 Tax=unclassified Microbacterium TaxID=2609290 RepID=UPI000C810547|nr:MULTISPECIES: phospholipase D-like domain-containing protein [unclassified Microbacterium]MCT1396436.1 phospholipase D-like domain-containing protein [Microbacterium sp. p3-SID338]PMC06854.1 hypothetical protein CJ226_02695 [Microbacterium sp. UMB0228]
MSNSSHLVDHAYSWLSRVLASADGPVLLSSPYLSSEVCRELSEAARRSPYPFVLVTALDPGAVASGHLTPQGLRMLMDAGVKVRHADRLHAKCFIVGSRAMIGSANLTGAGLGSSARPNRELGVVLASDQVDAARALVTGWPAKDVTPADLADLMENAKKLGRVDGFQDHELDATSALHLAERLLLDARDPGRSLWLKLEYGEPALDGWREESWFASSKQGKPGFRAGDLVIVSAKETRDCYAVVEVVGGPDHQPDFYIDWTAAHDPEGLTRWPWVTFTKPRLVPSGLLEVKLAELGVSPYGLQKGHVRLGIDQFSAGVRALARLSGA